MSHSVLGNISLARKICTFLPLEELPNVCKTNKSLRRLTETSEEADQTLRSMLRTVNNANADVYARFFARKAPAGSPLRHLLLIRQMPVLQQLKVTTSDGHSFLIGLERLHDLHVAKPAEYPFDPHRLTGLDLAYRGPVHSVEFSALANYQQLQRVRIDCPAINVATIDVLRQIPTLTEVGLLNFAMDSFACLSSEAVGGLLLQFPNLRALTLAYRKPDPSVLLCPDPRERAARMLESCGKNLTSISLHGSLDDPRDVLRMIGACPHLTFLDVTGSRFATRWTAKNTDGYEIIWYEALESLAKKRPNLKIQGPPRD